MRELVDRFNDEHENISVAMNVMIWDPDFYQKTPAEVADSLGLREEGFAPVAWKSGFYNGQRYGIPLDMHPLGIYYNKKVMREAGLDPEGPPTTGDQYMRM